MRSSAVVSALLALVGGWGAAPAAFATQETALDPGMELFVSQFESWRLDQEREVLFRLKDGGYERGHVCGTPPPTREFLEATRRDLSVVSDLLQGIDFAAAETQIPLVFHIIQKEDGTGWVADERIAVQIEALNKAFKRFGAEFVLLEVRDVVKKAWYKKCLPAKRNGNLNRKYFKMTRRNAIDPATTVNIYTCKPWGDIGGFGVLAGWLPEDDPANAIVLLHSLVAGGPYVTHDKGITLVHEMGHYLGLLHTFHPGTVGDPIGCEGEGDFVDDTPYEAEPAYDCVPRDSCSQPGMDPIKNYMDYTDDLCKTKFTRGQRRLMEDMTFWYRPTLFGFE